MKAYVIVREGVRWYYDTYEEALDSAEDEGPVFIHKLIADERQVTVQVEYEYRVQRTIRLGLAVGPRDERQDIITQAEDTIAKLLEDEAITGSIDFRKVVIWENDNV